MRLSRRSALTWPLAAMLLAATVASTGPTQDVVRISGRVLGDSGAPIPAAQVFIPSLSIGVLSDLAGRYALDVPRERIAGDTVRVVVQRIGFHPEERVLRVATDLASDDVTIDFRLREEVVVLDEIIVSGRPGATQRRALGNTVNTGNPPPAPPAPRAEEAARRPDAAAPSVATPTWSPASAPHYFPTRWGGGGFDREQYAHLEDNRFRPVREHPLSTFSIDVDRASYSNVRRFLLGEHRLPPADAVQIEEMINYFSYDYEMPGRDHPVAVTTELGRAPWNEEALLLRIGLASRPIEQEDMPPANLVFLIDVSGSMASPDKLPLVKESLRLLVEQLRPEDRVSIVVYAGAAGLVLEPTSGARRREILRAIENLEAGGSTAGGAGLRLAYDVARRSFRERGNNRVILATDGDFNVGESSDGAMVRLIEDRRDEGTFLTVLGFGTGNLQFQKMQMLAQHGNGNHAYIDSIEEARRVLVSELGGTLLTVAQDVKVQVEFNPAHVRAYRLVGYENRLLANEDFDDDRKDAGDLGAGHRVTALYEIVPAGAARDGGRELRYQGERATGDRSHQGELAFVRVRYKPPRGDESRLLKHPVGTGIGRPSADFQFAAAVAGFGMLLRQSEHRGDLTAERVLSLAEDGLARDPNGERRELLEMVHTYQVLTRGRR